MTWILISLILLLGSCSEGEAQAENSLSAQEQSLQCGDTVSQFGNNVMAIYQDSKNRMWIGSWRDGLYCYDGKQILHFGSADGLPSNRVEEIKEDARGNVYINTRAGLCKFDGKHFVPIPEIFLNPSHWALQAQDLWFKSTAPGHVCRYDGYTLTRLEIPKSSVGEAYLARNPIAFSPYDVYCIYKDSRGNMWFGTAMMGVCRYNGISVDWITEADVAELHKGPANGVRSIAEDQNGDFWFNSAYLYKVYNRNPAEKTVQDSATFYERLESIGSLDGETRGDANEYHSIIKDKANNLWIAIYLKGVWKYDGKGLRHFPIRVQGKDIPIFCLYQDKSGGIWLGTEEHGLWRLQGEAFVPFTP